MLRSTAQIPILLLVLTQCAMMLTAQNGNTARIYDVTVRGNAVPGFYLLAPTTNTNLNLVDHGGWLAHAVPASSAINLQRQIDGTFTYFVPRVGHIRVDSTFTVALDTIVSSGGSTDFHDVRILRNGNYLVLGTKPRTVDMSKIVEGGKVNALVGDALLEEQRADGTVVWSWNSKDHVDILDVTSDIDLRGGTVDYIHVNSVVEDSDGHYLISARHFDEVIKIHRTSGAIIWRLGGTASKRNQFRWLNDTTNDFCGFSHQHTISRTAANRLLLFDNGNLKNPEYSRAVEYEVDESAKTIRRIWQYRPPVDIVTRSMGSVERLPNGGTLIGWGRNFSKMVLTELDSTDTVVYQLANTESNNTASYRASKYPLKMRSAQRRFSAADAAFDVVANGLPVGIRVMPTRIGGTRTLHVERYSYPPFDPSYEQDAPLRVDAVRWTVRHDLSSTDRASMTLDLRSADAVRDPRRARVYHRPLDGTGSFRRLNSVLDSARFTHSVDSLAAGEYMVGYDIDLQPMPLSPIQNAVADTYPVELLWRAAIGATDYTVQVSIDSTFTAQVLQATTTGERIVIEGLQPTTQYYWRVGARGPMVDTGWSAVAAFVTPLASPSILEPIADTTVAPEELRLRWNTVARAQHYRVRVGTSKGTSVVDTVSADTTVTLQQLPGDERLQVDVTAIREDITSARPGTASFHTLPHIPTHGRPATGTTTVRADSAELRWTLQEDVPTHLQVEAFGTAASLVDDTVQTASLLISNVVSCAHYRWRARAVGTNGVSAWTPYRWFAVAGPASQQQPELAFPADGATVDAAAVALRWLPTVSSSVSIVQIDTTSTFADPIVDTIAMSTTLTPAKSLPEDQPLYWRVYETTLADCGAFSDVRQFVIPGSGLGPLSPTDGALDVPVNGEVRYTTSSTYGSYRVEFYRADSTAEAEKIFTSTSNKCRYLGLQPGTWYIWRVFGTTNSGEIVAGPRARFRTRQTASAPHSEITIDVRCTDKSVYVHGLMVDDVFCSVHDATGRMVPVVAGTWTSSSREWLVAAPIEQGVYVVTLTSRERVLLRRVVYSWN